MWNYLWLRQEVRDMRTELQNMEKKMDAALADLKASIDGFIATVNALVETHKTTVAEAAAKAVADDDAGEAVDLKALKDTIDAANAALVVPPAPPFEPSNQ